MAHTCIPSTWATSAQKHQEGDTSLDYTRLLGSLSYTIRPWPKKVNSNKAIKELNPKNGQGAWPEPLEADSTSRGGGQLHRL